jgi:hypothetical protein
MYKDIKSLKNKSWILKKNKLFKKIKSKLKPTRKKLKSFIFKNRKKSAKEKLWKR